MKRSYIRRYFRKKNNPFDGHLLKQDQTKEAPFFSSPGKESFIQPATSFIQKKESPIKEEEKVVKRKSSSDNNASDTQNLDNYVGSLNGSGNTLPDSTKGFFEKRMNKDFSNVRIHNDSKANESARSIHANAYAVGNNIVFGSGKYQPHSKEGKKLLGHELTHVVQQSSGNKSVQRDLSAYNKTKTEALPTMDFSGGSSSLLEYTAEAAGIRAALAQLIADGKVKEVTSSSGNKSWFAANHQKNSDVKDIEKAFADAGYSEAAKMAKALDDIHSEYLYSDRKVITITMFKNFTHHAKNKLGRVTSRAMTEYEIGQAKRVFKGALDYNKVTIGENSNFVAIGGYARTVGNTIYFPDDTYRSMKFMIHELTHVWQYQTTGWTYAPRALAAQIFEGYSYTPDGKTPDEALNDARAAGKNLYSFNKEQQGDILSDYFGRLQNSGDVTAYQPFINDIK